MGDGWYYAKDEKIVGPIPLENLEVILSMVSDPYNLRVWRVGFSDWAAAGTVKEIAALIRTPPPLPETRGESASKTKSPLPSILQTTTPQTSNLIGDGRTSNVLPPPNKKALVGIGGWLILVAIGQILGPLIFLSRQVTEFTKLDSSVWTLYPITFYGEAALSASFFVLVIYTSYLFFKKSRFFPRYFVYSYAAAVLLFPIDSIFVALTFSAYTGRPIEVFLTPMMTPELLGQLTGAIIFAAIWIAYIKKSKRVANTFVE